MNVIEQDGNFNLTIGNGQVLLGGNTVFPLHAQASADDPSRTVVAYTAPSSGGTATTVELRESAINGGVLGGLMSYRREALDAVQNDLGRLAAGLAISVNKIHKEGADLSGADGGKFFGLGEIIAIPGAKNSPGAPAPTVTFDDVSKLTAQDYRVEFAAGTPGVYTVTSIPNGIAKVLDFTTGDALHEGLVFTVGTVTPADGDSWLVQPTRAAAGSLSLAIDDPAKIAAAGKDGDGDALGSANGDNALKLAQLQTEKVLGNNSMSLNEAFSSIVNKVGVLTQRNATSAKAQATLIQQNFAAQQSVSGVNLNEEYVNLDRFQEQFRAASRLIDVSSKLFDTLLSLRN